MKQGELPFTRENRPWLPMDCIEGMNMQWMACMTNIPAEFRDKLGDWAAVKVEMHTCKDKPEISDACDRYAQNYISERVREIEASGRQRPHGSI